MLTSFGSPKVFLAQLSCLTWKYLQGDHLLRPWLFNGQKVRSDSPWGELGVQLPRVWGGGAEGGWFPLGSSPIQTTGERSSEALGLVDGEVTRN